MPKPPPINGKWVTSHENAAIRKNINNLNGLDSPKATCRADYEETNKKTGSAHQRNQQIPYLGNGPSYSQLRISNEKYNEGLCYPA